MKLAFRTLLVIAVCAMSYLCITSITTPIEFETELEKREEIIIKKLIDIRKVQVEYQKQNDHFCGHPDTLVQFILEGQIPVILKEGTLTDDQLKKGYTEEKVVALINESKYGKTEKERKAAIEELNREGFANFKRDTSYVGVFETLLEKDYTREEAKNLVVIPNSNGTKFRFDTITYVNSITNIATPLFEVSAHYDTYLSDLDPQQLINLKDKQTKLERFNGLKVGSIVEPNNHSGNWE